MRLLFLLAVVGYSSQHCIESNCANVEDGLIDNKGIRVRRGWTIPDNKTILKESSDLIGTLSKIKIDESFTGAFAKAAAKNILKAFKGVSFAGGLLSIFLEDSGDANTKKILDKMETSFSSLRDKLERQTKQVNEHVDKKFFQQFVILPVNTVHRYMKLYLEKNNTQTRNNFLVQYNKTNIKQTIVDITLQISELQKTSIEANNFDRLEFMRTRDAITRSFFQAYLIEYFHSGVAYPIERYAEEMDQLNKNFEKDKKKLMNSLKEWSDYFDRNYFKGAMKETVREALDKGGDNCEIAQTILSAYQKKALKETFTVVVSNLARVDADPQQYVRLGVINKTMATEDFGEKTVLLTTASSSVKKNANAYKAENVQKQIFDRLTKIESLDLPNILEHGKKGNFQMAVYDNWYSPCMKTNNEEASDFFEVYRCVDPGPWARPESGCKHTNGFRNSLRYAAVVMF